MPCYDPRDHDDWRTSRDRSRSLENERDAISTRLEASRMEIRQVDAVACWLARELGAKGFPGNIPDYVVSWIQKHKECDAARGSQSDSPHPLPEIKPYTGGFL